MNPSAREAVTFLLKSFEAWAHEWTQAVTNGGPQLKVLYRDYGPIRDTNMIILE